MKGTFNCVSPLVHDNDQTKGLNSVARFTCFAGVACFGLLACLIDACVHIADVVFQSTRFSKCSIQPMFCFFISITCMYAYESMEPMNQ